MSQNLNVPRRPVTGTEELARRAEALLTDPVLIGAFVSCEKDIWDRIKSSEPEQVALREHLYRMYKALEMVSGTLKGHMTQLQIESKRGVNKQP